MIFRKVDCEPDERPHQTPPPRIRSIGPFLKESIHFRDTYLLLVTFTMTPIPSILVPQYQRFVDRAQKYTNAMGFRTFARKLVRSVALHFSPQGLVNEDNVKWLRAKEDRNHGSAQPSPWGEFCLLPSQ